jgi:hypothetical protein
LSQKSYDYGEWPQQGPRPSSWGRRARQPHVDYQLLQQHPHAIIVCDEDATDELKHGTYKYFKDIEKDNLL